MAATARPRACLTILLQGRRRLVFDRKFVRITAYTGSTRHRSSNPCLILALNSWGTVPHIFPSLYQTRFRSSLAASCRTCWSRPHVRTIGAASPCILAYTLVLALRSGLEKSRNALRVLVEVGIQLGGGLEKEKNSDKQENLIKSHLSTYLLDHIRIRSQRVLQQSMQTLIKIGLQRRANVSNTSLTDILSHSHPF